MCPMNQMKSKLSDNSLLELLPLKGQKLTRWAIQAPGSLLFAEQVLTWKIMSIEVTTVGLGLGLHILYIVQKS